MGDVQKVFIARHGERQDLVDKNWRKTAENPGDPPLTEKGFRQAHNLGVRLRHENIQHIYASPFLRTVQTAHQVADVLSVPVRVEYGLSEGLLASELPESGRTVLIIGLFPEGQPPMRPLNALKEEMQLVSVDECSFWKELPFPEEYKQVQTRVRKTIEHYLQQHPEENVLFVGHALSVDYLARAILPEDQLEKDFFIPYCALADCIRDKRTNKWSAGKLWDDSFQQKGDK